ncbi:late competence protein ComER [Paenibacillus sp. y28]|uniref:late competence protein ComER n=1 Tax=Paenibacillus sp. y28 TaxID=3129110 RepID=UPI003019F8E0
MKVGFIGTGSMGTILIESFLRSGALEPGEIMASNRTFAKAERLAALYPGLEATRSNASIAEECDLILLCIKPLEFKSVLDEIGPRLVAKQTLISITSPVLVHVLESQTPCKVAKIIPSITNQVLSGVSLCVFGTRIHEGDRRRLEQLFSFISKPVEIREQYTRVSSDISSCGPAFLAFFLQKFAEAAAEETGLSRETAMQLVTEMALGTGLLLTSGNMSPETLQQRVSVPGGITAEGLKLLESELDHVFSKLIQVTHAKYEEDLQRLAEKFSSV